MSYDWREDSRDWYGAALELEGESRELRRIATALLLWLAEREELLELARTTIDRRWPERPR